MCVFETALETQANVTKYSEMETDEVKEFGITDQDIDDFHFDSKYISVSLLRRRENLPFLIHSLIHKYSLRNYGAIKVPFLFLDSDSAESNLELLQFIETLRKEGYYVEPLFDEKKEKYSEKVEQNVIILPIFISWKRTMYDAFVRKTIIDKEKEEFKENIENEINKATVISTRNNTIDDIMNKIWNPTNYNSIVVVCNSFKEADYLDGMLKHFGYKSEIISEDEDKSMPCSVGINLSEKQREIRGVLVG